MTLVGRGMTLVGRGMTLVGGGMTEWVRSALPRHSPMCAREHSEPAAGEVEPMAFPHVCAGTFMRARAEWTTGGIPPCVRGNITHCARGMFHILLAHAIPAPSHIISLTRPRHSPRVYVIPA